MRRIEGGASRTMAGLDEISRPVTYQFARSVTEEDMSRGIVGDEDVRREEGEVKLSYGVPSFGRQPELVAGALCRN